MVKPSKIIDSPPIFPRSSPRLWEDNAISIELGNGILGSSLGRKILGGASNGTVCQAVRRAARGQLQLHTCAHNVQTKNLKALCYKAAWLAPIDSLVQNQLAPLLFILDKK